MTFTGLSHPVQRFSYEYILLVLASITTSSVATIPFVISICVVSSSVVILVTIRDGRKATVKTCSNVDYQNAFYCCDHLHCCWCPKHCLFFDISFFRVLLEFHLKFHVFPIKVSWMPSFRQYFCNKAFIVSITPLSLEVISTVSVEVSILFTIKVFRTPSFDGFLSKYFWNSSVIAPITVLSCFLGTAYIYCMFLSC